MSKAHYITASGAIDGWRDAVLTGKTPTFYQIAETRPLSRIEVGPKLKTLIGRAPGSSKTGFVMQCVVDALRLSRTLRAVVCNIEMPPDVLLDRQLSRLSGVSLDAIRYRTLNESLPLSTSLFPFERQSHRATGTDGRQANGPRTVTSTVDKVCHSGAIPANSVDNSDADGKQKNPAKTIVLRGFDKSGRQELNLRPLRPEHTEIQKMP